MSNQIIAFNVISKVFTQHPCQLMKFECDIDGGAATTVYVQLHDARVLPGNGAVPIKSWPVPPGQTNVYKEFKNGDLDFQFGLIAVVSTTQATLAVGTGNNKFDSVAVELWNPDNPAGTSYAGDESTAVNTLQVWTEAQGLAANKHLYRIIVSELLGLAGYVWIMADDAGTKIMPGTRPMPIAASATGVVLDFGASSSAGVNNLEQDANYTQHRGCTLVFANSATDPTQVTAGKGNLKAEFK